jgi:hypothetical protein
MADNIVKYEKLRTYKYKIDVTVIDAGKEEELTDDHNVREFLVENNFNDYFFPLLKMQLFMSSQLYYRIQDNKNKVKFKIRVRKYVVEGLDDYERDFYGEDQFVYSDVFQGIFQPFMVSVDPAKRRDLEENADATADREVQEYDIDNQKYGDDMFLELYLFNLEHLNMNKKILNAVIQSNNITNTIGFIFNEVGIGSVIMNRPENTQMYDQILIPPLNFKNSIEYLSSTFGLFKSGVRQFLDFDRYYLLSNDLREIPVESGEYETVYVNVGRLGDNLSYDLGSYTDHDNKCYVINLPMQASFSSQGMFSKELDGSKIKTYEMKQLRDGTAYDEASGKFSFGKGYRENKIEVDGYDGDEKVTFAYNHLENGFLDSETVKRNEQNNLSIVIPFNDIDMEMLTINKRFILRFQDLKTATVYNGTYKLSQVTYGIQEGELYAMCEFKLYEKA